MSAFLHVTMQQNSTTVLKIVNYAKHAHLSQQNNNPKHWGSSPPQSSDRLESCSISWTPQRHSPCPTPPHPLLPASASHKTWIKQRTRAMAELASTKRKSWRVWGLRPIRYWGNGSHNPMSRGLDPQALRFLKVHIYSSCSVCSWACTIGHAWANA